MHEKNEIAPERIREGLKTNFIGQILFHFTETTSTNDVAKELAAKGAREGTVIISESQSLGRGRLGREWVSPRGGIWFSVILRPKITPKDAPKLTFTAAVVVAKTIRKMLKLNAEIKWPNDVLINGRKVCGILTETSIKGGTMDFAIVGVGINANVDVGSFPSYLRNSVTSLKEELEGEVDREKFLRSLLGELESYYNTFRRGDFDMILREWRGLSSFLGTHVEIVSFDEKFGGWAMDVDSEGALIIKLNDGTTRRVVSGDVTLRRHKKE
ncbi:MAG: putative biotin ligase [Candidatus Bathyarchaeota archaeon BA1]|nr:MAG: putative biotin ligase [Candidatus Bathyarchaeota archaeon BA1]